jgi:hypothetical protein
MIERELRANLKLSLRAADKEFFNFDGLQRINASSGLKRT